MKKFFIAVIAILMALCATGLAAEESLTITQVDQNGSSSCRRPHNAGVHAEGRTFICWAGPEMQQCVSMYNHKTGEWSKTRVVHTFKSKDYHDYPVIVKGADDHLHLFWSRHNGDLHYSRSPQPLGIQGKWTYQKLPASKATYPAPLVDTEGDIYVFYRGRGGARQSHFDYVKSADNGQTWTTIKDAIASKGLGFYLMHTTREPAHGDIPERLHLSWFLRRDDAHENIYFAYFIPRNDRFKSVDGTDLGENITEDELDGNCMVEKVTRRGWSILSHYREDGTPLVMYSRNGKTICARWNGHRWEKSETAFGYKEIEKCGPNEFCVYSGDGGLLTPWKTKDGGKTWQESRKLEIPVQGFSQSILIDDYDPEIKLFIKHDDEWNPKTYNGKDRIFVAGEN